MPLQTSNLWELRTHSMLKDPGHKLTQNSQLSAITDPWYTTHLAWQTFHAFLCLPTPAGAQLSITSIYLLINTQMQTATF